ncbi:MAG: succinate dehydrogenase, hydrophobic membrane anchor protein [Porticoccaceae bacterium]
MVKSVTSLSNSGLSNWMLQRISALIMTAYLLFMVVYFFLNPSPTYEQWSNLHASMSMRLFSLLAILSIAVHAWIGIWCVLTDYITVRLIGPKATPIRMFLQLAMIAIILFYVVWAIDILWGI